MASAPATARHHQPLPLKTASPPCQSRPVHRGGGHTDTKTVAALQPAQLLNLQVPAALSHSPLEGAWYQFAAMEASSACGPCQSCPGRVPITRADASVESTFLSGARPLPPVDNGINGAEGWVFL